MIQYIKKWWLCCSAMILMLEGFAQPNISRIEYYVDTDPGFGNGTIVSYSGTNDIATSFTVNMVPLTTGVHIIGVRSRDANGAWSIDNKWLFLKPYNSSGSIPVPNISRVEYFVDNDPGLGNATGVTIIPGQDLPNLGFTIDFSSLSQGVHIIGIRSKDANGAWSLDNKWLFLKPYTGTSSLPVPNINRVEYFVDNDPGYGHGISIPVIPGQDLSNVSFTLDFSAFSLGVHIISIRSMDANGVWSLDNKWLFLKPYNNNQVLPARIISAMEYYMDVDPGYGKGKPVALNAANQLANFNVFANITGNTAGTHKLFFRTMDDQRAWSLNYVDSFTVNPVTPAPAINVSSIAVKIKCAKDSLNVSFDASGTYNPGNQFNVELSDPNGIFPATPNVIGFITSTKSDSIVRCTLVNHVTSNSTGYHLRVVSTNPVVTGTTSADSIAIGDRPLAQTISGVSQVNAPATLTYSVPNVASSIFNWFVLGGTKINGGNTNMGDIQWPFTGHDNIGSIKIVEINQFGCVGDTSYLFPFINNFCSQNLSPGGLPTIDSVSITYTPLNNVSGPPVAPYYTNYPPAGGTTATVYRGDRFEISLKVNNSGNPYNVAAWVDYNNNNTFEPGENVILTSRSASVGSNWAQVPLNLPGANARLRIRVTTDAITANDYCKTFTNGETEDYTISFSQVLNCRWIGRVCTDWNNPANWSCGIVPDVSKSVLIPAGTAFSPAIINSDVTVDRLWIMPGASLTVNTGRTINVNGTNLLSVW